MTARLALGSDGEILTLGDFSYRKIDRMNWISYEEDIGGY